MVSLSGLLEAAWKFVSAEIGMKMWVKLQSLEKVFTSLFLQEPKSRSERATMGIL